MDMYTLTALEPWTPEIHNLDQCRPNRYSEQLDSLRPSMPVTIVCVRPAGEKNV